MLFSSTAARYVGIAAVALSVTLSGPAAEARLASQEPRDTALFNGTVRDIAYAGSVIYVAGDFTQARNSPSGPLIPRNHLAALNAETGQLLPWAPNVDGPVHALAVTKRSVVLGGSFDQVGSATRHGLAMVSRSSGAVRAGLHPNINRVVRSVALAHGRIYAGGSFTKVSGKSRSRLAAFDRSTYRLTSWRPRASGAVRVVEPVNKRLYVGGGFSRLNGKRSAGYVAALRRDGSLLRSFNPKIANLTYDVISVRKAVYVGSGGPGGHLYKLNRSGKRSWAKTYDGDVQALAYLSKTLYVGGHFENLCSTGRTGRNGNCLDAQTSRGKLSAHNRKGALTSWSPQANAGDGVLTMERSAAARLGVGGAFTTFGGGATRQPHFAEFTGP